MKTYLTFILTLLSFTLQAQTLGIDTLALMPSGIQETSGLIFFNNRVVTHNDSGDDPLLYELDSADASIVREVYIANASNNDWEDITMDDDYIYIGDIGNNNGNRTNLRIYKVAKQDFINTPNDTVFADSINYAYEDQTDFTSSSFSTNFDSEGIIAVGDSLYIFTKNWGDNETNVYALSKVPGDYMANKVGNYDVSALITGATYNPFSNEIWICGYNFMMRMMNFAGNDFFGGTIEQLNFFLAGSIQVEAICPLDEDTYFMSCEALGNAPAVLYKVEWIAPVGVSNLLNSEPVFHPNPSNQIIHLAPQFQGNITSINMTTTTGQIVQVFNPEGNTISIDKMVPGMYWLQIRTKTGGVVTQRLLVK